MRAEDLQVGDWVFINDVPLQVGALSDRVGFRDSEGKIYWAQDGFDRLEPIPLTEEILVKNGFEKTYTDNELWFTLNNLTVTIVNIRGSNKWYAGCEHYSNNSSDWVERQFDCKYIHQLQHLLRLCGVWKEIEL